MALAARSFDQALDRAIGQGNLASLEPEVIARLRTDATFVELPAGSTVSDSWGPAYLGLVLDGLVRCYVRSPDGREATLRYSRSGQLLGVPTIVGASRPVASYTQALVESSLLMFDPRRARALTQCDPDFARALSADLTEALWDVTDSFSTIAFGSIRQRIARRLLDLVAHQQPGTAPVIRMSQQQIADQIGSVREVVARVLRQLRDEGLVRTGASGIRLLDLPGLARQIEWPTGDPALQVSSLASLRRMD